MGHHYEEKKKNKLNPAYKKGQKKNAKGKTSKLHNKQAGKAEVKQDGTYVLGAILVGVVGFVAYKAYESNK